MSDRTKILICDDHLLFAQGLENLLSKNGYEVTVTDSSKKFLKTIQSEHFDLVLLDFHIDNYNGIELTTKLDLNLLKKTKFYLLTAYAESFLDEKAQKAGFRGVMIKSTPISDILRVLQSGQEHFRTKTSNSMSEVDNPHEHFDPKSTLLTKQEMEVIKETIKGKSTKEIAAELFISPNTVNTHRRNIYQKLDVKGIGALVGYANRYLSENLR